MSGTRSPALTKRRPISKLLLPTSISKSKQNARALSKCSRLQTSSEHEQEQPCIEDCISAISKIVVSMTQSTNKKTKATMSTNMKMMEQLTQIIPTNDTVKKNHKCANCEGRKQQRGGSKCWELEENAAKCPAGWICTRKLDDVCSQM